MFWLGVFLIILGALMMLLEVVRRASQVTETGFVVLIGPIPIIGGTSTVVILLAMVLTIFLLLIMTVWALLTRPRLLGDKRPAISREQNSLSNV